MSYRIDYSPEKNRKYPISTQKKPKWLIVLIAIMISFFALYRAGGNHTLKALILPGDPQVTAAAFAALVDDIRGGDPVGEAVTAFCLEIIKNA